MTVPSDGSRSPDDDAPADFDPYRFGAPEHPVPPEYAPPGYRPPAAPAPGPPPPYQAGPHQGQTYGAPQDQGQPYGGPQYPGQPPYQGQPYGGPPYAGQQGSPYPGQPPYPGQRHPPYGSPYGPPRTKNTKATLSLVFGILAILLCWISFYDLLMVVPAIVLGALGRSDAARYPEGGGRRTALTGLVCGIVGFVLAVAATVYIYDKVKPCYDQFSSGTSNQFQTCARNHLLGRDG